jgi:hypothetical protein
MACFLYQMAKKRLDTPLLRLGGWVRFGTAADAQDLYGLVVGVLQINTGAVGKADILARL